MAYAGQTWQVPNQFFPVLLAALRSWGVSDSEIALQLPGAQDRFVARWLVGRPLSAEAGAVLAAGLAVWRLYFAQLHQLRTARFKIATWDAGWWQARSALLDRGMAAPELAALKAAHDTLKAKLLPQVADLGLLG